MKIVCAEDYFHPNTGYQIGILSKYLASFGHEVTIVASELDKMPPFLNDFFSPENIAQKDAEYTANTGVKVIRTPIYCYKSGRSIQKPGFMGIIDSLNPDMLYIHGESSIPAMMFLAAYGKLKYPLILDSHMLEYASRNKFATLFHCFYRTFFTPIIKRNSLKVIRTQNSMFLRDALGIPLENAPWISFGSDTMMFHPDADVRSIFRKEHGIGEDDFVVVYAGKLDKSKGGEFFSSALREKINTKAGRNIVFLIVGNIGKDMSGDVVEGNFLQSENRIMRFPTQTYQNLPKFFQAADLAVIPAAGSLTFYDMQACGLPVLWCDETLNVERVSHGNGFHFKRLNEEDFIKKIRMCAEMDVHEFSRIGENALNYVRSSFDYRDIARQYERVLLDEYERQCGKICRI